MRKNRWIPLVFAAILALSGVSKAGALDKDVKGELTNWTWTYKCIDEWLVPGVQ